MANFPRGPVVKNLPHNAMDMGSIPGQGTKILHAVQCRKKSKTTTKSKSANIRKYSKHISDRELISRIHKELLQLRRKTSNQIF